MTCTATPARRSAPRLPPPRSVQIAKIIMGDKWVDLPPTGAVTATMKLNVSGRPLAYSGSLVANPNCTVEWSPTDGGSLTISSSYRMVK